MDALGTIASALAAGSEASGGAGVHAADQAGVHAADQAGVHAADQELRTLLYRQLAGNPEAQAVLFRRMTDAAAWHEAIGRHLVSCGATRDASVLGLARQLLAATGAGAHYTIDVQGAHNVQAGDGNIQIGHNDGVAAQEIHGPVTINRRHGSTTAPSSGGTGHSAIRDNYGAVGAFYGPVSIRVRHSSAGAVTGLLLTALLVGLGWLAWSAAASGPVGWSSLPAFGFAIKPTWWACLVPFGIGVAQSTWVGSSTPALRMISTVAEHTLGWPAAFAALVLVSPHRSHDHWYTSAGFVRASNAFNAYVEGHLHTNPALFTSAYVCLFGVGAISGLVAGTVERLKVAPADSDRGTTA